MPDLQNNIWKTLNGGYKIPFDASIPLTQLQSTNDSKEISDIFAELWDNLHHQGDIGEVSYYSVPVLVNICIDKKSIDWNYVGLCVLIENRRLDRHNPPLPTGIEQDYLHSLKRLEQYLIANLNRIKDKIAFQLTLSLFATLNGQRGLGKVIELMDDDIIEDFLERY